MKGGLRAGIGVVWLMAGFSAVADAQPRIAVASEPGTPVVATEILVLAGPADEAEGEEGIAYLAARSVTAPILPLLDSLGAHLSVRPQKDALSFTLTAAPDVWEDATGSLLVSLFHDPVQERVVARERTSIREELEGREANPADAANRIADAALYGADHPWGRPTIGTPASIARLDADDVDDFVRTIFSPEHTVAAVVGPVDPESARDHLGSYIEEGEPLTIDVDSIRPSESPVRREYNSITTWITVGYRFPGDADLDALRFLAQLALDELEFSPLRRSVFNSRAQIDPRANGGELRFQLVTPPEEADEWADRIVRVVEEVAHQEMHEVQFQTRLRRFRGERLQVLALPEERARELARGLLLTGASGGTGAEIEEMTVERLRRAVAQLDAPVVVLLGPFQEETN